MSSDPIPVWLTKGERILSASDVSKVGVDKVEELRDRIAARPDLGGTVPRPDRTCIPVGHIKGIAESFGFKPGEVSRILITPREVVITTIAKVAGQLPAFTKHRIPVVP